MIVAFLIMMKLFGAVGCLFSFPRDRDLNGFLRLAHTYTLSNVMLLVLVHLGEFLASDACFLAVPDSWWPWYS